MVDQRVFKKLSIFTCHSDSSYTQVNGHIEDFVTTIISTSQNHIESPLQSSYSGLMVEPSKFPDRHSDMSAHDNPFLNLQERGNSWFPVPTIAYTSASSLSSKLINNHHYMKTMFIKTDLSNMCQIMEPKGDWNLCLEMPTNVYNSCIWTINFHVHLHSFMFYFKQGREKWGFISMVGYFTAWFYKLFSSSKHLLCILGKWHLI